MLLKGREGLRQAQPERMVRRGPEDFIGRTPPGRRIAAPYAKTKWRPALLPASTVPRSVGRAREGETAFPREVPAEALRPRSVPQVPSQEYCYSGSGSCGFRAQPCGRLRFPGGYLPSRPCGFEIRFPIGRPRSELLSCPFAVPSARGLRDPPDPRRKVGSALACAAASRFFLPVARTSLPSASVRRLPPLSVRPLLRASLRFRKAAPCYRKDIGTGIRFAPNAESGSGPVDNGDIGDNMG
jgi:hypothetical protein